MSCYHLLIACTLPAFWRAASCTPSTCKLAHFSAIQWAELYLFHWGQNPRLGEGDPLPSLFFLGYSPSALVFFYSHSCMKEFNNSYTKLSCLTHHVFSISWLDQTDSTIKTKTSSFTDAGFDWMYHCFPILMKIIKGCLGKHFLQNIVVTKKRKKRKVKQTSRQKRQSHMISVSLGAEQ